MPPLSFSAPASPTSVTDSPVPSPHVDQKILRRLSSFWPSDKEVLKRHPSLEQLLPAHDCKTRRSSLAIAIINLVATVCGGGVLSLPLAFSRAGIIPATIMMIVAAGITDFSMYIMCSCARRTASRSYSECVRKAFGQGAEVAAAMLLILLLFFVMVAYAVLVKDIWTPVILSLSPTLSNFFANLIQSEDETTIMSQASKFILAFLILPAVLPLLLQQDLHALRHTCYVGVASAIVLMLGMVMRAVELNIFQEPGIFRRQVTWVGDLDGNLFAFPIICLSFFSIYNVPLVHAALFNPTRPRVKMVMDGTILTCLVLFYSAGLAGYLYAYDDTSDNILLNFPLSYKIILVGRVGYGVTIGFGMPLVFLPCRQNILALPGHIQKWREERATQSNQDRHEEPATMEIKPLLTKVSFVFDEENVAADREIASNKQSLPGGYKSIRGTEFIEPEDFHQEGEDTTVSLTKHIVTTLLLVICVYFFAVAVPGVGFVWSLVGSSMSMIIGFFVPCACYLKIRSKKGLTPRSLASSILAIFAIAASCMCSVRTFARIGSDP